MEKIESMLDEIFNARADSIASITKEEQEKINEGKTCIDIERYFPNATDEEINKIAEIIEMAVENISCEMWYFNEKYYKTGLADGIRLVIECMQRGWL